MEAAGFGFAQAKDTAQDAGTAPQEHGQAGPENVFAVKFWLHQVGQEGLNQHVNGAHPEGQAGSQHVDVVQDAFLGEENLVSFSSVNLWHPPLSDLLPSRAKQFCPASGDFPWKPHWEMSRSQNLPASGISAFFKFL